MPESLESTYRPLLDAVSYAARAHRGQLRKNGEIPYAAHVFRVCLVLRDVFGVADHRVLTAALLHDTVEDTTTDFDDLEERFGAEIAGWVALLSKDKRRPFEEREAAYCAGLASAPWQVQVCKLADLFDNILDLEYLPPGQRLDGLRKKKRYLDAIRTRLTPEAERAWKTVASLHAEVEEKLSAAG